MIVKFVVPWQKKNFYPDLYLNFKSNFTTYFLYFLYYLILFLIFQIIKIGKQIAINHFLEIEILLINAVIINLVHILIK